MARPHLVAALFLLLPALPSAANDDPSLSAEAFDALTLCKTMDTATSAGTYGVETFLPGRKVIWRDITREVNGTWDQVGDQICFTYEDKADRPVCWTYHDRADGIQGWYRGDHTTDPILLTPIGDVPGCSDYIGA
jgi:hypothetical protein